MMNQKSLIVRNIIWNWGGMICDAVAAFLVMPFLIHRLGESRYGTWILIGSLSSYFGMLDLGVRGSVGRFVAFHRARDDRAAINRTLSTALLISCAAAVTTMLAAFGLPWLFFRVFDIPQAQAQEVRLSLLLIGLNIAMSFPLSLFEGILWGYQRFDVINAIDGPTSAIRAVLTFIVIGCGFGLVGLALITVLLALFSGLAKALMSFRTEPELRFRRMHLDAAAGRELIAYGLGNLAIGVSRMIRSEVSPGLIGALAGLSSVTLYSVGKRFTDYAERVIHAAAGVVTPLTASLHASGETNRQRDVFLIGGRYCLTLSLFFFGGFFLLGRPLIELWLGPRLAAASTLLTILSLGEVLPLSQSISGTVLLGTARHGIVAWMGFAEVAVGVALAFLLVSGHGLLGVVVAIAVSGALCRGLAVLFASCRLLEVSFVEYLGQVALPPLAIALGAIIVSAAGVAIMPPSSWPMLAIQSLSYCGIYASASMLILEPSHRLLLIGGLKRRLFPT